MTGTVLPVAQSGMEVLGIPIAAMARILGFTLLSFVVAVAVGATYRWYFRQRANPNIAVLAGVGSVAIYLNTRTALNQVMADNTAMFELEAVVFNTVAFLTAGLAAAIGGRLGDQLVVQFGAVTGAADIDGEVSKVVQTVGRRIAVTLPDEIADIDGYDPVPPEAKQDLAGKTFLFPRRLTVDELRTRLVARLKDDYQIGYVDLDLAADGSVEYLAIGQRVPGLGPTLGPGQAATAITADPPNAASPGDLVQLWRPAPEGTAPERVATAEIRGIADDVVTIVLDEHEAQDIAGGNYRLITLPAGLRADREFARLLRAADETMAAITVAPHSPVAGTTVGDVDVTIVAIKPAEGAVVAIPSKGREIAAGETLYVVARPDRVRRLERDAGTDADSDAGTEPPSAGGDLEDGGETAD